MSARSKWEDYILKEGECLPPRQIKSTPSPPSCPRSASGDGLNDHTPLFWPGPLFKHANAAEPSLCQLLVGKIVNIDLVDALEACGANVPAYHSTKTRLMTWPMRQTITADYFESQSADWLPTFARQLGPYTAQASPAFPHLQVCTPPPSCPDLETPYHPQALLTTCSDPQSLDWAHVIGVFACLSRGETRPHEILKHAFVNSLLALQHQSFRNFVPSLTINSETASFSIVDRECVRVATISDCWGQEGFASLAALLTTILDFRLDNFGFLPFFDYALDEKSRLKPCAISSCVVNMPAPGCDADDWIPLSTLPLYAAASHFGKATFVARTATSPSYVIKVQAVEDEQRGRERDIHALLTPLKLKNVVKLHSSTIFKPLPSQISTNAHVEGKSTIQMRHYEIQLLEDVQGIRIDDPQAVFTPEELLRGLGGILETVVRLWKEQGILHRDICTENILVTPSADFYLIDWGCAIAVRENTPPSDLRTFVGTPDTMAVERLADSPLFPHRARHEAESLVTTLFKVITIRFLQSSQRSGDIDTSPWQRLGFGVEAHEITLGYLALLRNNMYACYPSNEILRAIFSVSADLAKLLCRLLRLRVPTYHYDSDGYYFPSKDEKVAVAHETPLFYAMANELLEIFASSIPYDAQLASRWMYK